MKLLMDNYDGLQVDGDGNRYDFSLWKSTQKKHPVWIVTEQRGAATETWELLDT